jgi:hypothetical protein
VASVEVKVGKLSEKEGKGKEGLWGIRGTVYGKAKRKQNGSRLQGFRSDTDQILIKYR